MYRGVVKYLKNNKFEIWISSEGNILQKRACEARGKGKGQGRRRRRLLRRLLRRRPCSRSSCALSHDSYGCTSTPERPRQRPHLELHPFRRAATGVFRSFSRPRFAAPNCCCISRCYLSPAATSRCLSPSGPSRCCLPAAPSHCCLPRRPKPLLSPSLLQAARLFLRAKRKKQKEQLRNMAIIQTLRHLSKPLFHLLHWILLVSAFFEKVDVSNIYIFLALLAFPVVLYEGFLKRVQLAGNSVFQFILWVLWGYVLVGRYDVECTFLRFALLALPFVKSKRATRMAQKAVKSVFHLILWVLWAIVLIGGHDLGCSSIRFALLALLFVRSKRALKAAKTAVRYIRWLLIWTLKRARYFLSVLTWIPWMVLKLVFPMPTLLLLFQILIILMQSSFVILPWILWMHILMSGFEVPFLLCEAVSQLIKTTVKHVWLLYNSVKITSVEEYLNGHTATMFHNTLQIRICSRDGQRLWQGFINVVLNAYDNHRSWAGSFNKEHLKMSGSTCIIDMEANNPVNFQNLLLDLAKLATLLVPHFRTINKVAPGYVEELYSSMTAPLLPLNPPPAPQQIERFVMFMRNHPALRSARKTNSFVRKVFEASKCMGQVGSSAVQAAVGRVSMLGDWRTEVMQSGHVLLNRTLYYRADRHGNVRYGVGALHVFRFIRNFLTHGAERDVNGQQTVNDMEELDLITAEFFCHPITVLVYHLVMDIEMTGLLQHAWEEYL